MPVAVQGSFLDLITNAIQVWSPGSQVSLLKELTGGISGAIVLLVDISSDHATDDHLKLLSGQFVLKLFEVKTWKDELTEQERHKAVEIACPRFAKDHVPKLLGVFEQDGRACLLYDIAGLSLLSFTSAETLDAVSLQHLCGKLGFTLLDQFSRPVVRTDRTPSECLRGWLGYRLTAAEAPSLHDFVAEQLGKETAVFFHRGRVLLNPLVFCELKSLQAVPPIAFWGLLHGDLHSANCLVDRYDLSGGTFWLIDFALSKEGPIGYDHAYFELSLLMRALEGAGPERLFGLLEELDSPRPPSAPTLPIGDIGIYGCIRSLRARSLAWQERFEPRRRDSFLGQELLARVAVSLNWANKKIERDKRILALMYGAWAARLYMEKYCASEWEDIRDSAEAKLRVNIPATTDESPARPGTAKVWQELWERVGPFDEAAAKYILITGKIRSTSDFSSLSQLPWSLIVDNDPESDSKGLYSLTLLSKLAAEPARRC